MAKISKSALEVGRLKLLGSKYGKLNWIWINLSIRPQGLHSKYINRNNKIMLCKIVDYDVKKVLTESVFAKSFQAQANWMVSNAVRSNQSDTVVLWARGGQWISAGNLLTTVRIPAFFDLTCFYETNRSAWSLSRSILREKKSRFRRTGFLTYHPLK